MHIETISAKPSSYRSTQPQRLLITHVSLLSSLLLLGFGFLGSSFGGFGGLCDGEERREEGGGEDLG
jgi:hypothetical protein